MTQRRMELHLVPASDVITSGKVWDIKFDVAARALQEMKPHVGLMFVAPGMYWGRREGRKLEREIATEFGKHFTNKLIVVGCNISLNEDAILLSCDGSLGPANGTLSLFLSKHENLRIHVAHDDATQHSYTDDVYANLKTDFVDQLLGSLEFGDNEPTAAVIFFANSLPPLKPATQALLRDIRRRSKREKFPVWGGFTNDDISVAENIDGESTIKDSFYVLLRLSGRDLQSWSMVMKCTDARTTIGVRLSCFKRSLLKDLKRHSVLLISGPTDMMCDSNGNGKKPYTNCQEFRNAIKRTFPEMPIMGMFGNLPYCIGNDSRFLGVSGKNVRLLNRNCVSLMILTYD